MFACAAAVALALAVVEAPAPRAQEAQGVQRAQEARDRPSAAPAPKRYRTAYVRWRGRLRRHHVFVGRNLLPEVRTAQLRGSIKRMRSRWTRWLHTSDRGRGVLFERKVRNGIPGWGRSRLRAIASCESHGNPRAVGGGGAYRGMYQFSISTWSAVGGRGDPAVASRWEQTWRAWLLLSRHGSGHWPVCG